MAPTLLVMEALQVRVRLRHAAATLTLLLTRGVRLEAIQGSLGHASFRTTRDLHTDARPEIQRDAADRMNTFLSR
jgi:site-specific recombinase XerD